jgi:hypothetical protein
MAGSATEEMLELWASSFRDVKERLRPLFKQQLAFIGASTHVR